MSYTEIVACLRKESYKCAFKLWGFIAVCSIILVQLPVYYFHQNNLVDASSSYFWFLFFRNWSILMALSLVACILSFKFTAKTYQSYWSPFGIKLATFFSTELFISMTLIPFFLITKSSFIFPYYVAIIVMLVSTLIGSWLSKLEILRSLLRQRAEAME